MVGLHSLLKDVLDCLPATNKMQQHKTQPQ
jgi:hypothetical protein